MRRRRKHEPERNAALYVTDEMGHRQRERFEHHLMECEDCWREVRLGREGKLIAERARELAPAGLRDDVRAAVTISRSRSHPRFFLLALALGALVIASGLSYAVVRKGSDGERRIIGAVVELYGDEALPGVASRTGAPDLAELGLELHDAADVELSEQEADVFEYRTGTGDRVLLFVSPVSFPRAVHARADSAGWHADVDGLSLVCRDEPVPLLLVGPDRTLLTETADALATARFD